jgi:hypothetical protein
VAKVWPPQCACSHPQCFNYKLKQSLLSAEQRARHRQPDIYSAKTGGCRGEATDDDAAAAPRILIKSWPVIKFDEKSCECNLSFRVVLAWLRKIRLFLLCVGAKGRRAALFFAF